MPSKLEAELLAALKDALEGMEDMVEYVDRYYQIKWGHPDYIARAKEAIKKGEADAK